MTRSHAPIDVRRVGPDCREFRDPRMIASEVTHRVGCAGVTGEREGLAAAAAKIQLATRAACARLLHPCAAAESIEGRGICPDVGERMLAHVPEFKAGNLLGAVTSQHYALALHVELPTSPAPDARLWVAGVIVGHHGV